VTTDGQIVILEMSSVRILDGDGELIKIIDLTGVFSNTFSSGRPTYLHEIVADNVGGFLFAHSSNPPEVVRYDADGTLRSLWSPHHPDGRTFDIRPAIRVAPDGRLWTCDGKSVLRLTDDGVVDLVLGPKSQPGKLEEIAAFTVDGHGDLYAVAQGSGVVHVFDRDGKPKRTIKPDPIDVAGTVRGSFIAVKDDGEVFVKKPQTKVYMPPDEYLRFSASGERLEAITFKPSIPVGEFLSPGWAFQPVTGYRCGICQIRGDTRLVIVDPPDKLVREVRRRPNGKFFGDKTNLAMAPDGSMAILDYDIYNKEKVFEVDLFSAAGDGIRTIRLPSPLERYSGIAFDGKRAVVTENNAVLILDTVTGKHKRWSLSDSGLAEGGWDVFIIPKGEELMLFDRRAHKLHRYHLPKRSVSGKAEHSEFVASAPLDLTDTAVKSPWVKSFLEIVAAHPKSTPCIAYIQTIGNGTRSMTEAQAMELPEEERSNMRTVNLDECAIRFDSPRIYARMLDLAAVGGLEDVEGKRVLDFGCCDILHLQSLARLGVDVVGTLAGYSMTAMCNNWEDVGELFGPDGQAGNLEVLRGGLYEPDKLAKIKGDGFDLITVGNVLQNPEPEDYFSPGRWLQAGLGRDKEAFVAALYELVRPGGLIIVYNAAVEPTPAENAVLRDLWERAGFEIQVFDQDDRGAAIGIGKELGWEAQAAPLEGTIRARYTVVQRPAGR